uniref:Uncharacterized protein n=1 Tax=Cyanoderma ruficeps TaxID=181631 RepID=A0A8C3QXV0_9PASS
MSYYGYQYKQQCFIPGGMKSPAPAFPQPCPGPGLLPCSSCSPCSPCSPSGAKLCTVRKTSAGPGCVETRVVEGHRCCSSSSSSSSSCGASRCLGPWPGSCPAPFPQPLARGGEVAVLGGCPQVCRDSSCPYSYQWAKSYQYSCGQ